MGRKIERVGFGGAMGHRLAAVLERPPAEPRAWALFAHCFSCSKDLKAVAWISRVLVEHEIGVLRFDFTGLGESEGDFSDTNFSSNLDDVVAAADYLRRKHRAPRLLIGHSLGGAAVLAAAHQIPEARAICTIGAPADPAHVAHHFQNSRKEIEATGEAEVLLVGRPFRIQKQFLEDIESQKLETAIAGLKKALLVFHSPVDQTVGIENAQAIYVAAKHPKSFVSLDDADHLLSRKADAAYVADVISAWAARYLDVEDTATDMPALTAEAGTVVVRESGEGKFANDISVGGVHLLRADEPAAYGGNDSGPSPYDYLLAALGACKSMTIRMYAERKGIALDRATVSLRHQKIHAEDCDECETPAGKVDEIQIEIGIEGDLDEATRARLAEIADMCPVHKTLHSEVHIESRLKA